MHNQGESPDQAAAPNPAPPPSPGLLEEIGQLGRAVKYLFGAQLHLLAAELGLARRAITWILIAGLAATVVGVGLGLSILGLIGVLLEQWLGSWWLALVVLCVLQILFFAGAIWLFHKCMHWMSFPVTRKEWGSMMGSVLHKAERKLDDAVAAVKEEIE